MISFDFLKLQVKQKEVVLDSTLRLLRGSWAFWVSGFGFGGEGFGSLQGSGSLRAGSRLVDEEILSGITQTPGRIQKVDPLIWGPNY